MQRHRFQEQLAQVEQAQRQSVVSRGFVACPVALTQGWQGQSCPWEEVYKMAFAQAQAVVRPSRVERIGRDLLN